MISSVGFMQHRKSCVFRLCKYIYIQRNMYDVHTVTVQIYFFTLSKQWSSQAIQMTSSYQSSQTTDIVDELSVGEKNDRRNCCHAFVINSSNGEISEAFRKRNDCITIFVLVNAILSNFFVIHTSLLVQIFQP